jgi:hypothetical protein
MSQWYQRVGITLLVVFSTAAQADFGVELNGTDVSPNVLGERERAVVEEFYGDSPENLGLLCYQMDLLSLSTGRAIGVGVDCLDIIGAPDDLTPGVTIPSISPQIEATTFMFLPGGHIVNQGLTTVRPFFDVIGNAGGEVTHLTGSIPATGTPTVVDGSGRFSGLVGAASVRLSGAVSLANFPVDNSISFRCLFVVKNGPGKAQGAPGKP